MFVLFVLSESLLRMNIINKCFFLLLLPMIVMTASCNAQPDSSNNSAADDLKKKIVEGFERLVKNQDVPLKEIEKLQQREYTVIRLPFDTPMEKIEGTLNEFGKNRWDCFHIEKVPPSNREEKVGSFLFFCKRMPETPLRYVPQSILGR
jgi:hypothetical protein